MHLVDVGVQDDESSITISYLCITMPLGAQAPIQVTTRRTSMDISLWTVITFLWLGWLAYVTTSECRIFKQEED